MSLTDFSTGAQGGLQQLIARRLAEQQRAQQLAQQQFQNERLLKGDARDQQQIDQSGESIRLQREIQAAAQQTAQANTVRDDMRTAISNITPDSFINGGTRDAAVQSGAEVPERFARFDVPKMAQSSYVSPEAQAADAGKPVGYFLGATPQQREKQASDKRLTGKDKADADRGDKQVQIAEGMLTVAQDKARTAATNAGHRPAPDAARGDRSYQYTMTNIDKSAVPYEGRVDRLERLQQSIDQGTPIADSVTIPELISAMAGGMGSGVRITNAEIQNATHTRSTPQDIAAWLNKAATGKQLLPEQRQQIGALIKVVRGKLNQRLDAINAAREAVVGTNDPEEHRRLYSDLRANLTNDNADSGSDKDILAAIKAMMEGGK